MDGRCPNPRRSTDAEPRHGRGGRGRRRQGGRRRAAKINEQRERMREKGATGVARAGALRDLGTNAKAADCRELYAASKRNGRVDDACARQAALEAARDVIRRNADPEEVELALDLAQKALQRRKSGGPRDEDAMARLGALQCLREGLKSNDEHVQALAYRRPPNAAKALADGDDKVRRCAAHVVSDALGRCARAGPEAAGREQAGADGGPRGC